MYSSLHILQNLTGAYRIILYDLDWNPQTNSKAKERDWRFRNKNTVTIYRLITAGTIEDKIYQQWIFKTVVADRVLQDPWQWRLFSQRYLQDLFTIQPDIESVSEGGEGLTENRGIAKGAGVIDPDDDVEGPEPDVSNQDN